jgi:hypothetical protein
MTNFEINDDVAANTADHAIHQARIRRNEAWANVNSYLKTDDDEAVLEDPVIHHLTLEEGYLASQALYQARKDREAKFGRASYPYPVKRIYRDSLYTI